MAVWVNLHLPGVKQIVQSAVRPLAGVYLIVNLVTGDMYVGSGITHKIGNRFHKHLFGLSGSVKVAPAVVKFGLDQFAFVLLATLPGVITEEDNADLLALEQGYLDTLDLEYNIAQIAGSSFGVKHSEKTKAKMRANYSSERREAIGALNQGTKLSTITIQRITAAALARPPMSEVSRALISENSAKAELYEIKLLDGSMPGIILRTIPTIAEHLDCHERTVRRALQGNGIIKRK